MGRGLLSTLCGGAALALMVVAVNPAQAQTAPGASAPGGDVVAAVAVAPGEAVAPGDFLTTRRVFGSWTLVCDVWIAHRRVCMIEGHGVADDGSAAAVRIFDTADGKVALSLEAPGDIDAAKGLAVESGTLGQTVPALKCAALCGATWVPDVALIKSFSSAESLGVVYIRAGVRRRAALPMTLFGAVMAAATHPDAGAPSSGCAAPVAAAVPARKAEAVRKPAHKAEAPAASNAGFADD
jgi:invasion protein IalB